MTTPSLSEHHDSMCKVMPPLLSTSGHQLQNLRGSWPPSLENGRGFPKSRLVIELFLVLAQEPNMLQILLTNVSDILKIHFGDRNSPYVFVVFLIKELFLCFGKRAFCVFGQRAFCVFGQRVFWVSEALPSTMQWMQGLCIESSWFCLMPSSPIDG